MYRVLLVDDDALLLSTLADFLQKKGCMTKAVLHGAEALALLVDSRYDLVLLDVKMPEVSGFDLCSDMRALTDAPIVFFSSMSETECQLLGYERGGVDYITKDCPLELFWAKLRARMDQSRKAGSTPTVRSFPPLTLDLYKRQAMIHGELLPLTSTEFQLLELMSSNPRATWSVEQIYRRQWGDHGAVDKQLVQVHLSHLRRKLQKAYPRHDYLETVWGKGYQFVPIEMSAAL